MNSLVMSAGWLVLIAGLSVKSVEPARLVKVYETPVKIEVTRVDIPVRVLLRYEMGKPDLMIKNSSEIDYIGNDIYNDDGLHQTKEQNVASGETAIYNIRIQNDADFQRLPDNITVKGSASDSGFTVGYFHTLYGDITSKVTTTGWSTGPLDYGSYEQITLHVTPDPGLPEGSLYEVLVIGKSDNDPTRDDAVKAVTFVSTSTAVEEPPNAQDYSLDVTSNPARGITIEYSLAQASDVVLAIYDVTGREVKELVSGRTSAGTHSLEWDGHNNEGEELPSGVYFARFEASSYVAAQKLILVR